MSTTDTHNRPLRILRRPEVSARTGLPQSTLYTLIAQGKFPRPVKIGERSVGWPEHVVEEHIRKMLRDGNASA
jgi:prophage regulatory protein